MSSLQMIQEQFPQEILSTHSFRGDDTVIIKPENLRVIAQFLKETPDLDFNFLMDVTAVDYLQAGKKPRFEVVYHFYSLKGNHRLRVKVPVEEKTPEVDTLSDFWPSANWYEREIWDMFGIKFKGHPNLKRILMYEEFKGHPLRKDYPFDKRQPLVGPE
ncbi:MAG: NADH-quinone oxidoreductase subunit C [Candidatus Omnitrophica bacterium]|nr:NADH-quinone oxidoreductase subunit C [Candidatus Omnitrophota bacterium]